MNGGSRTDHLEWLRSPGDLVLPGTVLCRRPDGRTALPRGDRTEPSPDGQELRSTTYGTLRREGAAVRIEPAARVGADLLEATILVAARAADGRSITLDILLAALEGAGVREGILRDELAAALARAGREGKPLPDVRAAAGRPAVAGKPASLSLAGPVGGLVLPGEVAARRVPPTAGEPGARVNGTPIPATTGPDADVAKHAGPGVRRAMEGAEPVLVAEVMGELLQEPSGRLSVRCLLDMDKEGELARVDIYHRSVHGTVVTADHVRAALKARGVVHGIDQDEIAGALARSRSENRWIRSIPVAQATLPTDAEAVTYDFRFKQGEAAPPWPSSQAGGAGSVPGLSQRRDSVSAGAVLAVARGAASGARAGAAQPGTNIFGRPIPAGTKIVVLRPGPNVEHVERDSSYLARVDGFPQVVDGALEVVPAVAIAADRMSATLQLIQPNFRDSGGRDEAGARLRAWVADVLGRRGVHPDRIDAGAIAAAVERAVRGEAVADVVVARGTLAVPGEAGRAEFLVEVGETAGKVMEGDAVDFRERGLVHPVGQGDPLARIADCKAGQPGLDVFGKVAEPARDPPPPLVPGPNVKIADDGTFVAVVAGNVTLTEGRLEVSPVFFVKGDLDYETGNIDFPETVIVKGDIKPLFEVKAGKRLEVGGVIEGARVECGGDVVIHGGISGKGKAEVRARGSVTAKYIEQATVEAGGDVVVAKYISHSTIRSGGKVTCPSGSIRGGEILAFRGVVARGLGSAAHPHTLIQTGRSIVLERKLVEIDAALAEIAKKRERVVQAVQKMRARAAVPGQEDANAREMTQKLIAALRQVEEERNATEKQAETIRERMLKERVLKVEAIHECFEGVEVRLADRNQSTGKDYSRGVIFKIGPDGEIVLE